MERKEAIAEIRAVFGYVNGQVYEGSDDGFFDAYRQTLVQLGLCMNQLLGIDGLEGIVRNGSEIFPDKRKLKLLAEEPEILESVVKHLADFVDLEERRKDYAGRNNSELGGSFSQS